jgi:hypothetical protein
MQHYIRAHTSTLVGIKTLTFALHHISRWKTTLGRVIPRSFALQRVAGRTSEWRRVLLCSFALFISFFPPSTSAPSFSLCIAYLIGFVIVVRLPNPSSNILALHQS